jgi:hypothetical protein
MCMMLSAVIWRRRKAVFVCFLCVLGMAFRSSLLSLSLSCVYHLEYLLGTNTIPYDYTTTTSTDIAVLATANTNNIL